MKLLKKVTALLVAVLTVFALIGCDEIIDGSKITTVEFELEFYGENGQVEDTKTVTAKLYNNVAPTTVKHVTELIKSGYYNGVCVSNVQSNYFEFGGYEADGNGLKNKAYSGTKYSKEEYNGGIYGEFSANGFKGQNLTVKAGAILLKHDAFNDEEVSKYNTGKATLMVCTSSSSALSKTDYALFGYIVDSDGKEKPSGYEENSEKTDRTYMSSLEIVQTIADLKESVDDSKLEDVVTTTYYYETEKAIYTKVVTGDKTEYFYGYADGAKLSSEEVTELEKKLSGDEKSYFLTIPSTRVVIKKARVK